MDNGNKRLKKTRNGEEVKRDEGEKEMELGTGSMRRRKRMSLRIYSCSRRILGIRD